MATSALSFSWYGTTDRAPARRKVKSQAEPEPDYRVSELTLAALFPGTVELPVAEISEVIFDDGLDYSLRAMNCCQCRRRGNNVYKACYAWPDLLAAGKADNALVPCESYDPRAIGAAEENLDAKEIYRRTKAARKLTLNKQPRREVV